MPTKEVLDTRLFSNFPFFETYVCAFSIFDVEKNSLFKNLTIG